jgi:uncharacterized membrane protein SpoIIM required for sporulation/ABC-type transport system involved in multi-copper enzyme maturation permease subunit
MLNELRPAFVIVQREVRDQLRDWRIIFPVLGLTLFFPFLMDFTAAQILNFVRDYGASIIGERMVPFLMMIVGFFPISVSLVIALESFVGEKERGSIEPLLNSPLKDWQLYLGKLLSSTIPPLLSSYIGMTVYTIGLAIQGVRLPEPDLFVLILAITTIQAVVMVAGAVVVSSQATSVRAANLLASFIIIPMALLIQGESVIMFWGDYRTLWLVAFGLLALTILLVRVGLAHFQREELLGREIDVLNLKWAWKVFWRTFSGESLNLKDWYIKSMPVSLKKLKRPFLVTAFLAVVALLVGILYVQQVKVPESLFKLEPSGQQVRDLLQAWPLFSAGPVLGIWWQNVRALLLGMILGGISLGIFGLLPIMATMAVLGGILGIVSINGASPILYFGGFILPHGIIEIPAALLATAAVLQAGAILATPTPGRTVGEVFITSMGEWAKIMVGVIIPTLLVAAAIEAWVTPRIALLLFG